MSNKTIYKTLFPFLNFVFSTFFFVILGFIMYQEMEMSLSSFLIRYVIGSICSIIIISLIGSFFKARKILSKQSEEKKRIFLTYYILIPYVPGFVSSMIVILLDTIQKNYLGTPACLYIIAFVSSVNYLFSIVLNVKLKVSTMIDDF